MLRRVLAAIPCRNMRTGSSEIAACVPLSNPCRSRSRRAHGLIFRLGEPRPSRRYCVVSAIDRGAATLAGVATAPTPEHVLAAHPHGRRYGATILHASTRAIRCRGTQARTTRGDDPTSAWRGFNFFTTLTCDDPAFWEGLYAL